MDIELLDFGMLEDDEALTVIGGKLNQVITKVNRVERELLLQGGKTGTEKGD